MLESGSSDSEKGRLTFPSPRLGESPWPHLMYPDVPPSASLSMSLEVVLPGRPTNTPLLLPLLPPLPALLPAPPSALLQPSSSSGCCCCCCICCCFPFAPSCCLFLFPSLAPLVDLLRRTVLNRRMVEKTPLELSLSPVQTRKNGSKNENMDGVTGE